MKKSYSFYFIFSMFVAVMFIFASCTKEGPAGPPGKNGEDGINGTDGTATCGQCHDNSQAIEARINQWEHSVHATGGNYERNTGECATCHTSQGFLGNLDGTYDWTADGAMISNPNPINCYTCHQIHSTYTAADLAYTVTDPVELRNTGGQTHDFGKGNLCASCHQGRTVDPFPVPNGADVVVDNTRWGIHHGPQSNFIAGMGLFEVGSGYSNSAHSTITNACVQCHMAEAYGSQAGGHTWNMTYSSHGSVELNTAGCLVSGCHADAATVIGDFEDLETEVDTLLAQLQVLLTDKGIYNPGTGLANTGTYSANVAGAYLNWEAVEQDRSHGAHNPAYIKKLLNNSIAALQ